MAIFHLFESARMMLCRLTPIPAKSPSARFPPEPWRQVRRITPYAPGRKDFSDLCGCVRRVQSSSTQLDMQCMRVLGDNRSLRTQTPDNEKSTRLKRGLHCSGTAWVNAHSWSTSGRRSEPAVAQTEQIIMATGRRRKLLKVIILGDSGYDT
jgi:hypothetical protein